MKVGFFGKLPSYGDFVQRNVSPELTERWDNWLMQSIDTSQSQLKDNWRELYFTSPVWRFTVQQGVISSTTVSGLMMPSVDASGRNYPFFVFCELSGAHDVLSISAQLEPLHLQAEELIIELLNKVRPNLDDVAMLLSQHYAKFKPASPLTPASDAPQLQTDLFKHGSVKPVSVSDVHQAFCSHLLARQQLAISIWAHSASEHFDHLQRYFNGMPPVDAFASLLYGS